MLCRWVSALLSRLGVDYVLYSMSLGLGSDHVPFVIGQEREQGQETDRRHSAPHRCRSSAALFGPLLLEE
jgi:hypothetical protein